MSLLSITDHFFVLVCLIIQEYLILLVAGKFWNMYQIELLLGHVNHNYLLQDLVTFFMKFQCGCEFKGIMRSHMHTCT